jgi:hypothetical protein
MSDKAATLMERDRLADLVHATARPDVSAHTIPRALIEHRLRGEPAEVTDEIEDDDTKSISPLAVLLVLAMLMTVFVAVARL